MSSRRQKLLARINWYLQFSLKHITEWIACNKLYYRGGRYRQFSPYHTVHAIPWRQFTLHGESTVHGLTAQRDLNTLRPRYICRHCADNFKSISFNEKVSISLEMWLKFVPKVRINNIPAFVQMMVWHRPGKKSLSEPMMVSLLTHICVTRPQWMKGQ